MAPPATLQALLGGLVDYAGLFPPAGLPMPQAVGNYARYRGGADAWALGRFATPVARFAEFEAAFASLPPQPGIWNISALLGADPAADFIAIAEFNRRLSGRAQVDAVEVKTATAADISHLADILPSSITAYCEISPAAAPGLLPLIREAGMRAKIRTGGLTPDAFPTASAIADFLCACAAETVAFKATAGLHHPLRCVRPLTYEPNAATGVMHGFLNLFLAATLARRHEGREQIMHILQATDAAEFIFGEHELHWRELTISHDELAKTREHFAISFGSCSFEEPISDLQELRLL